MKKLGINFKKITECKSCSKLLTDDVLSDKIDICSNCYEEYMELKKHLDKYVRNFNIDKQIDANTGNLISQYRDANDKDKEELYNKIFFNNNYKELVYQYLQENIAISSSADSSSTNSSKDSESLSDSDFTHKKDKQTKQTRKDIKRQEYELLNEQHGKKLKDKITEYCSASTKTVKAILSKTGFKYPASTDVSTCIDSVVYMYLNFKAYNWKIDEMVEDGIIKKYMEAGKPFLNSSIDTGQKILPHTTLGTEYDATVPEHPNFRGFFRFVRFQDDTVYFTRDHYLTFINMETGTVIKSTKYLNEEKKKK